jgi:hypothetical protein
MVPVAVTGLLATVNSSGAVTPTEVTVPFFNPTAGIIVGG